jgi:hypothetical protein
VGSEGIHCFTVERWRGPAAWAVRGGDAGKRRGVCGERCWILTPESFEGGCRMHLLMHAIGPPLRLGAFDILAMCLKRTPRQGAPALGTRGKVRATRSWHRPAAAVGWPAQGPRPTRRPHPTSGRIRRRGHPSLFSPRTGRSTGPIIMTPVPAAGSAAGPVTRGALAGLAWATVTAVPAARPASAAAHWQSQRTQRSNSTAAVVAVPAWAAMGVLTCHGVGHGEGDHTVRGQVTDEGGQCHGWQDWGRVGPGRHPA